MTMMMMNGGAGSCGRPCAELAGRLPVPGQKFVQLVAFGLTGDDALQHIGQIGLRIKFVELCCANQRCPDCPALGAALAATEQLVAPAHCNRAH
jgi:hypothetical protein